MTVSYAIMAHPSRRPFVDYLLERLGDVPVAWSEPPDAYPGYREPVWRTCRAAMLMHTDAPFHCVLQDDVIPCPGFLDKVDELVAGPFSGGDMLGMLFYRHKGSSPGWRRVAQVAKEGRSFTLQGRLLGPAVVYPTALIDECIAACDPMPPNLGSDDRIKVWAVGRGIRTYVPIPSLVDHRVGPSLVGHPLSRVAWRVAS